MNNGKRHIFLGGNARSGTTALVKLFNCHPAMFIMNERYLKLFHTRENLTPDHFSAEALLSAKKGFPDGPDDAESLKSRYETATFVGDKLAPIFRRFAMMDEQFKDAELFFIVRNPLSVVESYQARLDAGTWTQDFEDGVRQWNASVRLGLARKRAGKKLVVLCYEELFRSRSIIAELFASLGLSIDDANQDEINKIIGSANELAEKLQPRNEDIRFQVSVGCNFTAYRKLMLEHSFHKGEIVAKAANIASKEIGRKRGKRSAVGMKEQVK